MDRQTVYAGQIPLDTDQLKQSQNTMVGLAKLSAGVLGGSVTTVNGFTVTPTTPASLSIIVTAGEVYQPENLEASAWGSLNTNSHTILKQGIILDPVTLSITPPGTTGYSQAFLVEVQYEDLDSGSTVLPYFNAAAPSIPFAGPGNAGSSQNTVRQGVASVQIKAGVAATTGTQVTPTQDAGWTGIYVVTVAYGATTITAGNIVAVATAPYIPVTLPLVPAGVQSGQWLYGVDTGSVNAMVANVTPIPTQLVVGMTVRIKAAYTNTGATTLNINSLGASAVHRANGAALSAGDVNAGMVVELVWDGAAWQISNYFGFTSTTTNNNTYTLSIPYAADTSSSANSVLAAFSPTITSLAAGNEVLVKLANTNTGPSTITVNSLSAVSIVNVDGTALSPGQMIAGEMLWLLYDGTHFQLGSPSHSVPALQANATYYVAATGGNDSYDGLTSTYSSGIHGPFLTLQHAMNVIAQYNLNGYSITVNVANGTYARVRLAQMSGSGSVFWTGNTSSPSSCVISGVNLSAIMSQACGNAHTFNGFELTTSGTASTEGLNCVDVAGNGTALSLLNINFAASAGNHVAISQDGVCGYGGTITVSGGASANSLALGCHIYVSNGGLFQPNSGNQPSLTITGYMSFSGPFVECSVLSFVVAEWTSITGSGYVTASKYNVNYNAVLTTGGAGINYIPGNTAGTSATGGQYS